MKDSEVEKIHAAKYVAENFVYDGQVIGVGTGTTVKFFIKYLAALVDKNELEVICVPSSIDTKIQLALVGLPTSNLIETSEVDIYVDGADIITEDYCLIKGGGAALTMEKIIAHSTQEFIVIADSSKYPQDLLSYPVPIEIIPAAINSIIKPIFNVGGEVKLRYGSGKIGPVISDNGNVIADIYFKEAFNAKKLANKLNNIPGVVENGLFPVEADRIVIGTKNKAKVIITKK